MPNNTPPPGRLGLDQLMAAASDARAGGVSPDEINQLIHEYSGGGVSNFDQLTQAYQRTGRVGRETAEGANPSALLTLLESTANTMGLGIPRKVGKFGGRFNPLSGASNVLERGEESHPWASLGGEVLGTVAPSAIMATAVPAEAAISGLERMLPEGAPNILPGILRTRAAGLLRGATAGATGAYAQSPDITPHPAELAMSALLSAPFGGSRAAMEGPARAAGLEPAQNIAGEMIQYSAPGTGISERLGARAIESGETTPQNVGSYSRPFWQKPLTEEENADLPPILRRMNFEKSAQGLASMKHDVATSPGARADFAYRLQGWLDGLRKRIIGMSNDLRTGYNSILTKPVQDEGTIQAWRSLTGKTGTPTLRQLANDFQTLGKSIESQDRAHYLNGAAYRDVDQLNQYRSWHDMFDQTLRSESPEYAALKAKQAPYFQREEELKNVRRKIIGRTMQQTGRPQPRIKPNASYEQLQSRSFGYEPEQIADRTARQLLDPYMSTSFKDLEKFVGSPRSPQARLFPAWQRSMPARRAAVGQGAVQLGESPEVSDRLKRILTQLQPILSRFAQ